jgi:ketosteroid isomerase-like protein
MVQSALAKSYVRKGVAMAESAVELVTGFLAAMNLWDFPEMRARLHPDRFTFRMPYHPAWMPGELEGREAYLGFAEEWSKAIDGTENLEHVDVHAFADEPGTVIARFTNSFELVESGFKYANDLLAVFAVQDGLITLFEERLNPIPLVLATGGEVLSPQQARQSREALRRSPVSSGIGPASGDG